MLVLVLIFSKCLSPLVLLDIKRHMTLVDTFVALDFKLVIRLEVSWHTCRVTHLVFVIECFVNSDKYRSKAISCVLKIDEQSSSYHIMFFF